jgi:hypothetical protein
MVNNSARRAPPRSRAAKSAGHAAGLEQLRTPERSAYVRPCDTLVFIQSDGSEIPFPEFLKREKETRGCSWKELAAMCGLASLKNYHVAHNADAPDRPRPALLGKIAEGLGYARDRFRYHNDLLAPGVQPMLPERGSWEYGMMLWKIAECAKERGGIITQPLVTEIAGSHFCREHAQTDAQIETLLSDIKALRFKKVRFRRLLPKRRK